MAQHWLQPQRFGGQGITKITRWDSHAVVIEVLMIAEQVAGGFDVGK